MLLVIMCGRFGDLEHQILIALQQLVSFIATLYYLSADNSQFQGELEHRRPKGWLHRTDRKSFVKQMTQIERRQARIRRIKHRLSSTRAQAEDVATDPDVRYHIGSSQNMHQHIGTFLRETEGDPATKVGIFSC
jgi:hypothetical protein